MTATDLVKELELEGVELWEDEGRLRFRGPRGVMTERRLEALREHKHSVLALIREATAPEQLTPAPPGERHRPFPLSDVQAAYLLGRREVFDYGGVACHGYGELELPSLDPERLERAWAGMIARHDMLRAVIAHDGSQRVLEHVPAYQVAVQDLRGATAAALAGALLQARDELDHRVPDPESWPLFELRVTLADARAYLHLSIDFLVADFVSVQLLLDELARRYQEPSRDFAELEPTFRDYLLAERRLRQGPRYERDRDYWLGRIDDLPPAPELPILDRAREAPPRFRRHALTLDAHAWKAFRSAAAAHGVTPSGGVLAAYAATIARWSRHPALTMTITLLNRLPLHPEIDQVIGDFTAVDLLAVPAGAGQTPAERARAVQAQLWDDLDHRLYSGVELLRELGRRAGTGAALFPVVFTSAVGLLEREQRAIPFGELGYGISQTPQVWIDCQVFERGGELALNWDVREGIFPDGLVPEMFAAFEALLRGLAGGEERWRSRDPLPLPEAQARRRANVNATAAPVPDGLLHDGAVRQALAAPERLAVIERRGTTSYGELLARASAVAQELRSRGIAPAEPVGIVIEKGVEQVIAALGALLAGAAYVPVDASQPDARTHVILGRAGVRHLLTCSSLGERAWPPGIEPLAVDELEPGPAPAELPEPAVRPGDLAYVIFTSGSTGTPKGVMVSHRSALNTVAEVSRRYEIGLEDRVLALSSLSFDLSVYDVFGTLALGGALVLSDPDRPGDPSHWAELVREHGVTVWNSVPAQLQMLSDYLRSEPELELDSLRLAMLSGDWIPLALPDQIRERLPGLRLISMGGATEAAIWSIFHEIEDVAPGWPSIPYGTPLANQSFHVLDAGLRPCPDWVPGELYIGGIGLALGYLGDEEETAARFIVHPESGERLYRTGDLGRYRPGGEIEFLGREDSQVKIRGHRVELGEIEAVLAAHPHAGAAAVIAHGEAPLERRLAAFVEPRRGGERERGRGEAQAAAVREAARQAGELTLTGVQESRYFAYAAALNGAALLAMLGTLRQAGLFAGPNSWHTEAQVFDSAGAAPAHRRLLRRWLRALVESGMVRRDGEGRYGEARPADDGELERTWRRIEELQTGVDDGASALVEYFRASTEHLPALLRGEREPLQLLFPGGGLEVADSLYHDALVNRYATAMLAAGARALAHGHASAGEPLRVLEVGAGVGGSTIDVLAALGGLEVDYLFTDLSQFFLGAARERFAAESYVRYGIFDLEHDYRAQGLEPNRFDVIVAADVLHSTRHVGEALDRLRELLVPGGWLLFAEMTRDQYQIMASLELMTRVDAAAGDFVDLRQGRDQTFLSRQEWLEVLAGAGAQEVVALPGAEDPWSELGMHVFAARFKGDRAPLTAPAVLAHAHARLPDYMVPAQLQVIDALPLTANGKLDQRRLQSWVRGAGAPVAARGAAPETELESAIAAVWTDLFGAEGVPRDGGFFELGGDSLLAAQTAGRLREVVDEAAAVFFDDLLRMLLQGPTVASLARELAQARPDGEHRAEETGASPLVELSADGDRPPRVLIGGEDSLAELAPVIARLAEAGGVLGLRTVAPSEPEALEVTAGRYAQLLLDQGRLTLHLVGLPEAEAVALEVARHLLEAGTEVLSLTVAGAPAETPPSPYLGDVTLLVPEAEAESARAAAQARWQECCLGEVELVTVPGDRRTAFDGANAAAMAAALARP